MLQLPGAVVAAGGAPYSSLVPQCKPPISPAVMQYMLQQHLASQAPPVGQQVLQSGSGNYAPGAYNGPAAAAAALGGGSDAGRAAAAAAALAAGGTWHQPAVLPGMFHLVASQQGSAHAGSAALSANAAGFLGGFGSAAASASGTVMPGAALGAGEALLRLALPHLWPVLWSCIIQLQHGTARFTELRWDRHAACETDTVHVMSVPGHVSPTLPAVCFQLCANSDAREVWRVTFHEHPLPHDIGCLLYSPPPWCPVLQVLLRLALEDPYPSSPCTNTRAPTGCCCLAQHSSTLLQGVAAHRW